jgi:hypothetical protein
MTEEQVNKLIEAFLKKHLQIYLTMTTRPSEYVEGHRNLTTQIDLCLYFPEEDRVVGLMSCAHEATV